MSGFRSAEEFREVMDRTFDLMSSDPDMGPKLREADTPQRWEFPDLGLVVNVAANGDGDSRHNLTWVWSDEVDWEAEVRMTMDSVVANRYFQGRENIAMGMARGTIDARGNYRKALALVPVTKPVFERYRAMCQRDYPHLVE